MIDRHTFRTKIRRYFSSFKLDYDFTEAENVFLGDVEGMNVRILESGKAMVEYHGVVRRVHGSFEDLFAELLDNKTSMMTAAFGEVEQPERP